MVTEVEGVQEVGLKFQVRRGSGKVETLLVDAASALVGTAAHCEVRLSPGAGAHEHVEILAMDGAVHLTTRGGVTPPQLDGAPIVSGIWPRGSVLTIGELAMTVDPVDLRPNVKRHSPLWALAIVPFIALGALFARPSSASEMVIPPAPALFDSPVAACPNPPSPTLGAFAAERARIGYTKRERSPFSRGDGVEAVTLLETAAACYRTAGLSKEERATRADAQALRSKLEEEYRARRVRVEHAVRVRDAIAAKRELASLLPLTAHRSDPYVAWLAYADRWATFVLGEREAKRYTG